MSKKNKKNLQQLLEKRRALQAVTAAPAPKVKTSNQPSATQISHNPEPIELESAPDLPKLPSHHTREILRTLISVFIITIVLAGAIILDKQTNIFSTFGNWLYGSLKLKN